MWRSLNRGGNYNSNNQNGFASFNLNNARTNANANIGFRSALLPFSLWLMLSDVAGLRICIQYTGRKGNCPLDLGTSPGRKKPVSEPAVGHGSRHAPAQI